MTDDYEAYDISNEYENWDEAQPVDYTPSEQNERDDEDDFIFFGIFSGFFAWLFK